MKMSNFKKHIVKGFTLTEMIVVIAIISILAAVLTPTMSTYYWKARVKTANANAKAVYNTAQSAVQRYISIDRTADTKSLFFDKTRIIISYSGDTHSFTYSITDGTTATGDVCIQDVVNYVNMIVSDAREQNWSIYVDNYTVKASAFANSAGTSNVGYYCVGAVEVERINRLDGANYGNSYADAHEKLLIAKAGSY